MKISMDGRGRWMDNVFIEWLWRSVKYEFIYLFGHTTLNDLRCSDSGSNSLPGPPTCERRTIVLWSFGYSEETVLTRNDRQCMSGSATLRQDAGCHFSPR